MIIKLEPHHYDPKAAHKSEARRRGLAIDNAWKELFGELPVEKFSALDGLWSKDHLGLGILTHEVKSFSPTARSITISAKEVEQANFWLENKWQDHLYWIIQQVDNSTAKFLGVAPWSTIKQLIKPSQFDGNSYVMLDHLLPRVKKLSEIGPPRLA